MCRGRLQTCRSRHEQSLIVQSSPEIGEGPKASKCAICGEWVSVSGRRGIEEMSSIVGAWEVIADLCGFLG